MIASSGELDRFRRAATDVGCAHVHVVLTGDPADVAARFHDRPTDLLHHRLAARTVEADGGAAALGRWHEAMAGLVVTEPGTILLPTAPGDVDGTYAALLAALQPKVDSAPPV